MADSISGLYGKAPTAKHWKRVLYEIYRFYPNTYSQGGINFNSDKHPLALMLRISGIELNHSIMLLEKFGYINRLFHKPITHHISVELELTKEGVSFIDAYLHNRNQTYLNMGLLVVGIVSALGVVVSVVSTLAKDYPLLTVVMVFCLLLLIFSITLLLFQLRN